MKLIFLIAIITCLSWTGSYQGVSASDENFLSQGVTAFYDRQYDIAYNNLLKAFDEDPGNLDLNFYLGRAAFETGNYEMAVMAYERILIAAPREQRVKLEIARSFYKLGDYAIARKYCNEVLAGDPPPTVRDNILSFSAVLDRSERVHFFSGQLSTGVDWNNNVWSSPANKTIRTVIGDINLTGSSASKTQDWIYNATIDITHRYRPLFSRQLWKTQAVVYQGYYDKTDDLDTIYLFGQTGPEFTFMKDKLSLGVSLSHIELDYDSYETSIGFQTAWDHIVNPGLIFTLTLDLKEHDYPTSPERDSHDVMLTFEAGLSINNIWLNMGTGYQHETAYDDEYSYYRYIGFFSANRQLFKGFVGSLSYEYQYAGYKKAASLFDRHRMDQLHFVGGALMKTLWESPKNSMQYLSFNIKYQHIWADSNIPLYEYEKDIVQTFLSYHF